MARLPLCLALGDYDHVRDVQDGTVSVAGVDLTVLRLPVEEMFHRFLIHEEFDVSEASFAKIVAFAAADDRRFVDLRSQRRRNRAARGPRRQTHRRSGMGADRRGLVARSARA